MQSKDEETLEALLLTLDTNTFVQKLNFQMMDVYAMLLEMTSSFAAGDVLLASSRIIGDGLLRTRSLDASFGLVDLWDDFNGILLAGDVDVATSR